MIMLLSDFQSYFFLRTSKTLQSGEAPIYLRLQLPGARKDISTKLCCSPDKLNNVVNATTKGYGKPNRAI